MFMACLFPAVDCWLATGKFAQRKRPHKQANSWKLDRAGVRANHREARGAEPVGLSASAFCRWIRRVSRYPQQPERPAMNPDIKIYNLRELGTPLGQYSQVARVKASEFLFIAGMVATDAGGNVIGDGDFFAQCKQTFANIEAALRSANAGWDNVVQFTTYLVHSQDIGKFMDFRRREFPGMFKNGVYPPNTLLMIDRLVKEALLLEVQTVAAL
jgi:enamine deaminase RidA (YjgF/YER057c/UK114 family)